MQVYQSFADAPLEEYTTPDGDDRRSGTVVAAEKRGLMSVADAPSSRVLVVPFVPMSQGAKGDAVYGLKRAHARFRGNGRLAILMAAGATQRRTWGESFTRDLRVTQAKLGVPVTGRYDRHTWRALAPWFDALAIDLSEPKAPRRDPRLGTQLAWHQALYNRRAAVSYSQWRPSQLGRPETISRADCSGSVSGGCDWANILPHVSWRYQNTDTQILMGLPVPHRRDMLPGDLVLYGRGRDPSHVALYLGDGRVWSFGSYPIKLLPLDYRDDLIAVRRLVP
jgi:hypothetical protein